MADHKDEQKGNSYKNKIDENCLFHKPEFIL